MPAVSTEVDRIDLVDVSLEQLLCGEPHFWGFCHVPTDVLQCFVSYLFLLLLDFCHQIVQFLSEFLNFWVIFRWHSLITFTVQCSALGGLICI